MDYRQIATKFIKNGFSVIPVTSEKNAALREWTKYQNTPMTQDEIEMYFKDAHGIALLGGYGGVTILDFDLKYDNSGNFFERFKNKIPKELLKKMYVQSTKNKGFHFIFRCAKTETSKKISSRYTTAFEKDNTYREAFDNPTTRDNALKVALNDKSRVILESRGIGGYAVIAPSPGYSPLYGKIQMISEEEYDILFDTGRELNEVLETRTSLKEKEYKEWELSPFTDFNNRFDLIDFLEKLGWEVTNAGSKSKNVRFKRPGRTTAKDSAVFDTETRVFKCFSSSTSLDPTRNYSPVDLFMEFECGGDISLACKKMIELGFGKQ